MFFYNYVTVVDNFLSGHPLQSTQIAPIPSIDVSYRPSIDLYVRGRPVFCTPEALLRVSEQSDGV